MGRLPETWQFQVQTLGSPASLTVPAAGPNVRRIITRCEVKIIDISGGGPYNPIVSVTSGGTLQQAIVVAGSDPGPPISVGVDTYSFATPIVGALSTAIVILFNASKANVYEQVLVEGYDQ